MEQTKENSLAFWNDQSKTKAPHMEPMIIVFPDFTGCGYIDEDGEVVSTDLSINGCSEENITYWALLPEFPNAWD